MHGWIITFRKPRNEQRISLPGCYEARKSFQGTRGSGGWQDNGRRDYAQVLITVDLDGKSTVSMNGVAHLTEQDILQMAEVIHSMRV